MRSFLVRHRFEVLGVLMVLVFGTLHGCTSRPAVGLSAENGALQRMVQAFEARVSNILFRLRGERPASPDVVVVEIDERGAQRYGLWPWPRDVVARMIEGLVAADVKVMGLDIAFTDESHDGTESTRAVLAQLKALENPPADVEALRTQLEAQLASAPDDKLEHALKAAGPRLVQAVLPLVKSDLASLAPETVARYRTAADKELIRQLPGKTRGSVLEVDLTRVEAYNVEAVQAPLERFATQGNHLGHIATVPDLDGAIRRTPLVVKLPDGAFLPSLAVQVAAGALGATVEPTVDLDTLQLNGVRLRGEASNHLLPVQGDVPFTLINYPGPERVFTRVSAADVIEGTADRAKLAGKAVLVGVTITGSSGDQRVTPFNEFSPGVYTHASLVSNVLQQSYLNRPSLMTELEIVLMALALLGVAIGVSRLSSFLGKAGLITGVLFAWSLATYLAFVNGVVLSWVVPALGLLVTSFGSVFLGYLSVDREKLKLRNTFSRYLGDDVIAVALANPQRLNQGEKREMTVLFSDIRGFTSLSERMSPEHLAQFINQYLSPMTQIVFDEKGTLDKYIGDALMAFWNAPLDQADHALRACRAAVAMLEKLEQLKVKWKTEGYPELEIGIGINTGQMVVGNMGSDVRVDYTVLGDSVNLGSRLEGTTKEYDAQIIISEWTYAQAKDGVIARRLGAVRVKGKKVPVRIYELRGLGKAQGKEADAIATFEAALEAWDQRRFDEAKAKFREVLALWPEDAPSNKYLAAIEALALRPPGPEWDGVVSLTTK